MSDHSVPERDELKKQGRAQATPTYIEEANAFIAKYHRHSLPTVGGKFAVAAIHRSKVAGVAVAGRPVVRRLDDGKTARVAIIARLLGYTKVITYTLEEESGASHRAVGGRVACQVRAREWSAPSRRRKSQPGCGKRKLR